MRATLLTTLIVCCCVLIQGSGERAALAEETPTDPDAIILANGERVPCQILEDQGGILRVRIGTQEYDFERSALKGAEKAGETLVDPEHYAFVAVLAPRLIHRDVRLVKAAEAALDALGEDGLPAIASLAARVRDPRMRDALLARLAGAEQERDRAIKGIVDRQVAWAEATLALRSEQVAGFRAALESFFRRLQAGTPREDSLETLVKELEPVLDEAQGKALRKAWTGTTQK
jgi:hypothetical protein